jgi:hypothetical protein
MCTDELGKLLEGKPAMRGDKGRINLKTSLWGVVIVGAVMALTGCATSSDDSSKKKDSTSPETLEVIGTSGEVVDMDGTWARFDGDCNLHGDGHSELSPRVFDGVKMTETPQSWLTDTNCETGVDTTWVLEFTLSSDKQVTITNWVDIGGAAGAAPTGLADVTDVNGLTYTIDSATVTTNSDQGAADYVTREFCGETDWVAGTEHDWLDCLVNDFLDGENPFKRSMVVDDSDPDNPVWWDSSIKYDLDEDGNSDVDEDGYPTVIENFEPFTKQ